MAFPEVELIAEGGGVRYRRWLSSARLALARSLERAVPEPPGAFGQAILLGIRDGIPDSMRDDFRRSGASHLLAISGLHVGMALATAMAFSGVGAGTAARAVPDSAPVRDMAVRAVGGRAAVGNAGGGYGNGVSGGYRGGQASAR